MSDLDKYAHATTFSANDLGSNGEQGDRTATSMSAHSRNSGTGAMLQGKGAAHRRGQRGGRGCAGDGTLDKNILGRTARLM